MKPHPLLLAALLLLPWTLAAGKLRTDVEYGRAAGESLLLDASVPEGQGPFPAVILVHGGAWSSGDKSGGKNKGFIAPLERPLAEAGFAWFSINYRLAPKHRYPACIEDVQTAIRWVKAHAEQFHIQPERIALAGESAGGHLVALAAVRATPDTRVAAVVAFYAPFGLTDVLSTGAPLYPELAALIGHKNYTREAAALIEQASPVAHVKPGLPPFLLLHGTADTRVPREQSFRMRQRLQAAGVPCDLITITNGAHGMKDWETLQPDFKTNVVDWLKKTMENSDATLKPR